MKMIKKITAVTAALAAAASMSAVAFAANDFTATYDKEKDTVSVDVATLDATLVAAEKTFSDQITVVIVPKGAETINSSNIYYIDQDSVANKSALLTNMGVLAGSMVAGNTYEVRIGCTEGDIYTAEFAVDAGYKLGDLDNNGRIEIFDANDTLNAVVGAKILDAKQKKAADVDANGRVEIFDANDILNYVVGAITKFSSQSE